MSRLVDSGIEGYSRVFFVVGERTAIFDTGAPGNERRILRALKVHGIPQENVSLLIVSHAHWDHCGSLAALKAALKVPAMAGRAEVPYLEKGENAPSTGFPFKKETTGPPFGAVKVEAVVDEETSLRDHGIDAIVVPTPGHSDGSISVVASDGDCATGDYLASMYTQPEIFGQSMKRLIDGKAKRLYPAHGPAVDVETIARGLFS
jgi:hydroxyacylglutathione hydrolase